MFFEFCENAELQRETRHEPPRRPGNATHAVRSAALVLKSIFEFSI